MAAPLESPTNKIWKVRFLREGDVRNYLQTLYVSITGAIENAELLLQEDFKGIDYNLASGNKLVKTCFVNSLTWLGLVNEYSISSEIFRSQFFEPVKLTAACRIAIQNTTNFKGFAFSKSNDYYDSFFRGKVFTLSLIVPQLQTTMSIRCRAEQRNVFELGNIALQGVQPLPYVNRIHPYRLRIQNEETILNLSKWHFLKLNLGDVANIRASMAFENFSEIYSTQLQRRCLGIACILSGRLAWVRLPQMIIQSPTDNTTVTLHAGERLNFTSKLDVEGIKALEGQMIRAFVILWYESIHKGLELFPEIILIEKIHNERESLEDNILGFIRLRGLVPLTKLYNKFPNIELPEENDVILFKEGVAEWQNNAVNNNPIIQQFIKTNINIKNLRLQPQMNSFTLLMDREGFINTEKLREKQLIARLTKDKKLLQIILSLVKLRDNIGYLPKKTKQLAYMISESDINTAIWGIYWLHEMRFTERTKDETLIKKIAIKIIIDTIKDKFISYLNQFKKSVIFLYELEAATKFAPTLILKMLREIEKEGNVRCLIRENKRNELIWIFSKPEVTNNNDIKEALIVIESLKDHILSIFLKFPYPLNSSKITDELQHKGIILSQYTTKIILTQLEEEGKLTHKKGIWTNPWEIRTIDAIKNEPYNLLTFDDILIKTSIPPIEKVILRDILNKLEQSKIIFQPIPDRWCLLPKDIGAKQIISQNILRLESQKYIISTLTRVGGQSQVTWLAGNVRFFIQKKAKELEITVNVTQLAEDIISKMVEQKLLRRSKPDRIQISETK